MIGLTLNETKKCYQCDKKKPASWNFDLNPAARDGYVARCKSCTRINAALRIDAQKKGKKFRTEPPNGLGGIRV